MRASAISKPALFAITILLLCSAANALQAKSATSADLNTADLDAIVQRVIAQERVVGASVLVAEATAFCCTKAMALPIWHWKRRQKMKRSITSSGPCCRLPGLR